MRAVRDAMGDANRPVRGGPRAPGGSV
jgi:hypothetical protein